MTRNKSKRDRKETEPDVTPAANESASARVEGAPPCAAEEKPDFEALRKELETSKEKHLRLLADFDNYRRRVARDHEEMVQRANEGLMLELLPVLDHCELALSQADDPQAPIVVGVRMIYEQLLAVLGKAGLAEIDATGQSFTYDSHVAIAYQPSDSVPDGGVITQTRRGYRLRNRVLRHANVIVSSGPPLQSAAPSEQGADEVPRDDATSDAEEAGSDA